MKINEPVLYFYGEDDPRFGRMASAIIINRPTSPPTVDLAIFDTDGNEPPAYRFSTPHGQSLQECLEVGGKWITEAEAIGFGIDLEDGDQVLSEIEVPE